MAIHTDLPIHKTSCELLGVAIDAAKHMPRDFKSNLGVEIRKECIAIVLLIARANAAKEKVPHIERLLEHVDVLQIVIRVCHEKRLVSNQIFADAIQLMGSIGRQAGGWKKSASSPVSQLVFAILKIDAYTSSATGKQLVAGIGVPNPSGESRQQAGRLFCAWCVPMGGRAGGAARLAGARPVRQLPFRSSTLIGVRAGRFNTVSGTRT
jgi:hypothetical protein